MEYSHVCKLGKLTAKYEKAPKDVYCLDIEDNYDFCEETLLTIFINKLTPILGPPTLPNNWVSLLTEKIQDRKRLLEN